MAEDRLVFNYRSSKGRRELVFCALCVPALAALLTGLGNWPSDAFSDYFHEKYWMAGIFLALFVGFVILAADRILSYRNERIEIEDGVVVWFGKSGREKAKIALSSLGPKSGEARNR